MKRFGLGLCVLGLVALSARATTVTVSNLRAEQRVGTDLVDIYYDLDSTITTAPSFPVLLLYGEDTNALAVATSVTGAVAGVTNGVDHHIIWDAAADWGDWKGTTNMSFKVQVGAVLVCPDGGDATATAWEVVNTRWVRNYYADGAITMSDRDTNLIWVFDANANGTANWSTAKSRCSGLVYAGHDDWFLPNKNQLHAMYSQKSVFKDVQSAWYWSSTPAGSYAYLVNMNNGNVYDYGGTPNSYWVWPCRPGQ